MANEASLIGKYIYDKLSGDAEIQSACDDRVFNMMAPLGTVFPYVVFHLASGPTRRGTGGTKFFVRPLYLVRVFTDMEHDDDAVELAVQAVDRLLDVGRVNLLVDGLDMLGHHREALLELPISTTDTSSTIISRGGFYRFTARST